MACRTQTEKRGTLLPGPVGPPCGREQGSGTVLVVGAVAVVLAATIGVLMVISAVLASHRAHSAADLAALAAAGTLSRGADTTSACAAGMRLAASNGAAVVTCRAGPDLSIELTVHVSASMPRVGTATARARAGPSTTPG
jgi:secretion/DNA translocation related TadE-like protein